MEIKLSIFNGNTDKIEKQEDFELLMLSNLNNGLQILEIQPKLFFIIPSYITPVSPGTSQASPAGSRFGF